MKNISKYERLKKSNLDLLSDPINSKQTKLFDIINYDSVLKTKANDITLLKNLCDVINFNLEI